MGKEWHYNQNGQHYGPVSAAELKQMAASGTLRPTDPVWKEGMAKWVPARSIKGLFSLMAESTTPLPPPATPAQPATSPVLVEGVENQRERPVQKASRWAADKWAAVKGAWGKASVPVKIGIIGGGGLILASLVLIPILLVSLLLLFGGRTTSQGRPAGLTDSRAYTTKAFEVAGEQNLSRKDVKPFGAGTKDDFLQALAVLGSGPCRGGWEDGRVFDLKGRVYCTYDPPIDREKWVPVFGEPKDMVDLHDDYGSMKWEQQCSDGTLTVWAGVSYRQANDRDSGIQKVMIPRVTDP